MSREELRIYLVTENECLEGQEGDMERRVTGRVQRDSLEIDCLTELRVSIGDLRLEWILVEVMEEDRMGEEKEWNVGPYKRIYR